MLLTWVVRSQRPQSSLFAIGQRCTGARALQKCISAAQRKVAISALNTLHPQTQICEMLENLTRMLGPLGTFRGRANAAVGDNADDKEHNHDRAERDLHLLNEWQL